MQLTSISPSRNPVESTVLRLQSADIRNGGTHGVALSGVTPLSRGRPQADVGRMAQEANAWGNAQDMLTWARWDGGESGE